MIPKWLKKKVDIFPLKVTSLNFLSWNAIDLL